jgi:mono/diheme cytochrome c family protein
MRCHPTHAALLVFLVCPGLLYAAEAADSIDFAAQVQPVLSRYCYACHGPDQQKSGLRLDQREAALKPAESEAYALVPGKPGLSRLLSVIDGSDKELSMPPKGARPSAEQVAIIRKWIEQGAAYNKHWAFVAPTRPPLPAIRSDQLRQWPRNPIDHFIAARLEKEGLAPSPEADPYTLIRRVHLDLTGIPPTPEEADAFAKELERERQDPSLKPQAYEKLIDRLLASPAYGERWARRWLDLARYADTNGYEKDRTRAIWPYRDWVINALNDDMPFDQFTIQQIAGDMMASSGLGVTGSELNGKTPGPSPDSATRNPGPGTRNFLIPTGFHRNTMINEEGGIDVEEFRFLSVVDRVNTTSAVWLGLTIGCAQCHTHKYDPILQKEYYGLFAFLNNADEPEMEIVNEDLAKKRAEIEAKVRAMENALADQFGAGAAPTDLTWTVLEPTEATATGGTKLEIMGDNTVLARGAAPERENYTITATTDLTDIVALKLEALPHPSLPKGGPGRAANGNFVLSEISLGAAAKNKKDEAVAVRIATAEADFSQQSFDIAGAIDGNPQTGWAIDDLTGKLNKPRTAVFHFDKPTAEKEGTRLVVTLANQYGSQHALGRFRLLVGRRSAKSVTAAATSEKSRQQHLELEEQKWIDSQLPDVRRWTALKPSIITGSKGGTFIVGADHAVLVKGDNPNQNVYTIEADVKLDTITAIRLEVLPDESLPAGGPGRAPLFSDGDFHLGEFGMKARPLGADAGALATVQFREASHSFAQGGRSAQQAIDGDPDTAWSIKGGTGKAHQAVFVLKEALRNEKGFKLVITLDQRYIHQMTIGKFRLSATGAALPVKAKALPAEIEDVLARGKSQWSAADRALVRRHFLLTTPLLSRQQKEIEQLRATLPHGPRTMVMQERDPEHARVTHLHKRGEFLQPMEAVKPGVPGVLHPLARSAVRTGPTSVAQPDPASIGGSTVRTADPTRLDFARWLVDANNPLVGRVVMNRQWHAFFGRGIVRTTEDFGLQGEQPSHRDLLDWLAVEFISPTPDARTSKPVVFSMKHMHKLIVMSATYRQSSRVTPQLLDRDPLNILLARGPRFRVEAEMIRDSALAAAGLLSRRIGGPSVFPPQPEGVTSLGYGGFNWATATGENRYRRGLYTFAKRTTPYAAFTTFDGPAGDICLVKRDRSNTPLQALTMMNDTVFIEAAQALAKRVLTPLPLREGQGESKANHEAASAPLSDADKARRLFRYVLIRPPTDEETHAILGFVQKQRARLRAKEIDASTIVGGAPGDIEMNELAAWITAARSVMNLDEAVTKE